MRSHRFFKHLPTPQRLAENRFLKPFSRYLHHHFLWQFNRRGVAGGVAVGLFFGILIPIAQIFLAAIVAILLRVNLPVAAFSTLVSNPLTFPVLYYLAYKAGDTLTGNTPIPSPASIEGEIEQVVRAQQAAPDGWVDGLIAWMHSVAMPLAVGLFVLAVVAAVTGYIVVNTLWTARVRWRWQGRRQRFARHRAAG